VGGRQFALAHKTYLQLFVGRADLERGYQASRRESWSETNVSIEFRGIRDAVGSDDDFAPRVWSKKRSRNCNVEVSDINTSNGLIWHFVREFGVRQSNLCPGSM
jgi:hypothetical protein